MTLCMYMPTFVPIFLKHQKSTSERASAASAVPQLKRPTTTHSFPTKPQSRQIPLPEIQPTARPSEMVRRATHVPY